MIRKEKTTKIETILKKQENERSLSEQIELIDNKYQKKKKMLYEEFILLALIYDNVYFIYRQTEYQIDSALPNITSLFMIEYDEKSCIKTKTEEKFCSVFELFNRARIDGKTMKEIWDEVTF